MLPDAVAAVKSESHVWPRAAACLIALAAVILVLVRDRLFEFEVPLLNRDPGVTSHVSAGALTATRTSEWDDELAPSVFFTEFGPTPFVLGWAASLGCIAAGGAAAVIGIVVARRRRPRWSWFLSWALPVVGTGTLFSLGVGAAIYDATHIRIDRPSAVAIGAALLAGLASAPRWRRGGAGEGARVSVSVESSYASPPPAREKPHDPEPGASLRQRLMRRRWLIPIGAVIGILLFAYLASRGPARYDTYEEFLQHVRTAADERGQDPVTRATLLEMFGAPALVRHDTMNWSGARGEFWYYELKVGGAARLHVLFRDGLGDEARVRVFAYVDPGEYARARRRR